MPAHLRQAKRLACGEEVAKHTYKEKRNFLEHKERKTIMVCFRLKEVGEG